MTLEEIKNLRLGDIVQDLSLLKNTGKTIFCIITKIEDDRVYAIAYKNKDIKYYPHRFNINEIDCLKLDTPIFNIFDLIWNNNIRSFESLLIKDLKL